MSSLLSVHDNIAVISRCFVNKDHYASRLLSLVELLVNQCYHWVLSGADWCDRPDLYSHMPSMLMGDIEGMLASWLHSFHLFYGPITWRSALEMI